MKLLTEFVSSACHNVPVKHISSEKLDRLGSLLEGLRELDGLKEKKRGVFYRKSKAFLHFHEDPAGLFADVKLDGAIFERYAVTSRGDQRQLLTKVRKTL
jgi:hypothetical protein